MGKDPDEAANIMSWEEVTPLVLKAQAGCREAFGHLVEKFEPTVYAVALARLRNPSEAQELAQDVFIHVLRKLPQLRDPQCFAGWLKQITVRMAINRMTRRGPVRMAEDEVLEAAEASGRNPLEEMIQSERAAELHAALERLKPVDRATLAAFYLRGLSLQRMAAEFEAPVGTIKRRLFVARARLKEALEEAAAEV
jgi:RNA polymerase sigma-70 factor (ECF subfamily)